jgi:hypothetical protein
MQKFKLIFVGITIGILISIFIDQATYKPVVEEYHITLTQDWEKTCNAREKAYYEHLIRTKP